MHGDLSKSVPFFLIFLDITFLRKWLHVVGNVLVCPKILIVQNTVLRKLFYKANNVCARKHLFSMSVVLCFLQNILSSSLRVLMYLDLKRLPSCYIKVCAKNCTIFSVLDSVHII
jgi:hypothetical protein